MPEEEKPTGIKREDVNKLGEVEFEGGRAQLYGHDSYGDGGVRLELETFGGLRLALYGHYVRGGEFVEVDRERLG